MDQETFVANLARFETLQETLWAWQARNFGAQAPPRHALLGMCEEAGELIHSVLKSSQSIRGTERVHQEAMLDALGDIVVYLTDFYRRVGLDYLVVPPEFFTYPEAFQPHTRLELESYAFEVYRAVADIGTAFDPVFHHDGLIPHRVYDPIRAFTGELLTALIAVAGILGVSLYDCVQTVWDTVLAKRDWIRHPHTGESSESP